MLVCVFSNLTKYVSGTELVTSGMINLHYPDKQQQQILLIHETITNNSDVIILVYSNGMIAARLL